MNMNREIRIVEMFPANLWDCPEAFRMSRIRGYEPMTAKELDTEEAQNERFNSEDYFIEEKFDGTRALVYFLSQEDVEGNEEGFCRVFSRRISKKTGFYVENTDSLPQIRDTDVPDLKGTILDGELFINGLPFNEVSSTLNCLCDKAVERQIEKGFISFHAFDILFYKGINLRNMPLERRKVYLDLAIEEAGCFYIEKVPYYTCGEKIVGTSIYEEVMKRVGDIDEDNYYEHLKQDEYSFPNLMDCLKKGGDDLTPRAFYELIVSTGGEGVMLKPKNGKYFHKRGWEYSKVKKTLTRELIIMGFSEPTKEYSGKDIKFWGYWIEEATGNRVIGNYYGFGGYTAVTKHYYQEQVGNLLLGVCITQEEYDKIPKNKQSERKQIDGKDVMMVCECSGFDDETREYFTRNKDRMIGKVVEVKANELFKDSGKMRHPRFLRIRNDKEMERCVWRDHINNC